MFYWKTQTKIKLATILETGGYKKVSLSFYLQTQQINEGLPFNLICFPCSFDQSIAVTLSGTPCITTFSMITF